jgi:hypothetical protein
MKHVQVLGADWDWIAGIVERIMATAQITAILLMALTSVDSHAHYTKSGGDGNLDGGTPKTPGAANIKTKSLKPCQST